MKNEYGNQWKPVYNECAHRCAPLYTKSVRDAYTQGIHAYRANLGGSGGLYGGVCNGRGVAYTIGTFLTALASAFYCDELPESAVLVSWILFIMAVIWFDPVGILCKWVSKQSRFLIVFSLGMIIAAWFIERLIVVTAMIVVVSGILIFFKNRIWVEAEAWRMTDTVEKAMKRNGADTGLWLRHRPEVRTMMHECGFSLTDHELDSFVRDSWSLGYLHGNSSAKTIEKMQSTVKTLKAENKSLRSQLAERSERDESERIEELEHIIENYVCIVKDYELKFIEMDEDIKAYQRKFESIERDQEQTTEVVQGEINLYKEILDSDESIRATASRLDVKPWIVQHVRGAAKMFEEGATIEQVKESNKLSVEVLEDIQSMIA